MEIGPDRGHRYVQHAAVEDDREIAKADRRETDRRPTQPPTASRSSPALTQASNRRQAVVHDDLTPGKSARRSPATGAALIVAAIALSVAICGGAWAATGSTTSA